MKKRKTLRALCALLMVCALCMAACGKTGGEQAGQADAAFTPKLDPKTAGTVTVAGHYNNFEALEEEFNRFSQYYPNITLSYVFMDGYSKSTSRILSTALAGSEAPDIFFTYPWMGDWEDGAEIFACAENLADEALGLDLSCIRDNLFRREADGSILSVPIYTTTCGMLVNEDIFEKEHIAVPKTYGELLAACEALKAAGYENPVMAYNKGSDMLYPLFYPFFCAGIQGDEAAIGDLNAMHSGAGETMRAALELTEDFMRHGYVDLESCNALENNYEAVILRFFEGDVPMMFATGNTVSGTEKREAKSEAFTAHPFRYSFHPVPSTEEGGYFINTVSIGFGVNKNSENLALANEFMRFLVRSSELNQMAKAKRMVTPCADMSLDEVYAPFGELDAARMINLSELGLEDAASAQVSRAGWQVSNGLLSVDEAIAAYGTLE